MRVITRLITTKRKDRLISNLVNNPLKEQPKSLKTTNSNGSKCFYSISSRILSAIKNIRTISQKPI